MRPIYALAAVIVAATLAIAYAAVTPPKPAAVPDQYSGKFFKAEESVTEGSVAGISYSATAGTLVVHQREWNDAAQSGGDKNPDAKGDSTSAEASMFFVYYAKKGAAPGSRPITFLFNGGPGSSTVWLHMGAFGPKRVVTKDDSHTPAAPYSVIDNNYTLLDATDLVFVDAPGTGFSRIAGKDKEKEFYGVDPDAAAFSSFIQEFLSKYGRWNSPKYLFGESYGTPRASVVANDLESNRSTDFNGVILLSAILNFDLSDDGSEANPGVDLPYQIALPTYAATAWYHNKLPGKRPADMVAFVHGVEHWAMTDYALALAEGASLSPPRRHAIAQKLHEVTGLPVDYILKANLRIDGGEFEKNLQGDNVTTGRLDTRFSGPTIDPLSKEADYDPQSAAISSAYVSAFNDYARSTLNYGQGKIYHEEIDVFKWWDFKHKQPGQPVGFQAATNVLPDLADAMKYNPDLKVLVNGGYYDLATPYYEGWYEMHHLPMPLELQKNISYHYYNSGHMVYAHEDSLKDLHDTVAAFIKQTDNVK
jgi:carboxypeptidase C (cathepsin A)